MNVLVVDDDADFIDLIQGALSGVAEVIRCECSASARELMRGPRGAEIDLSIVDLCMPAEMAAVDEQEGLALVRWMESRAAGRPSILVTSERGLASRGSARRAGALLLLYKPLQLHCLRNFVVGFKHLLESNRPPHAAGTGES